MWYEMYIDEMGKYLGFQILGMMIYINVIKYVE